MTAPSPYPAIEPPADGYVYDLQLSRHGAVWLERAGPSLAAPERVCWRSESAPASGACPTSAGAGSQPARGRHCVVWTSFTRGRGTAYCRDLATDTTAPIAALAALDCEALAIATDATDTDWLLAATTAGTRLLRRQDGDWSLAATLSRDASYRPRLRASHGRVLAAWDDFVDGAYRVQASVDGGAAQALATPPGHWESLSAVAIDDSGAAYVARCRERLVELPGGAVNHHSRLVLARLAGGGWTDIAEVDIDHGMNPWLAPYWGFRRHPVLAANRDGVWLIWEEKIDSASYDPALGRLCAWDIGPQGPRAEAVVLHSGSHHYVVPVDAREGAFVVASKLQPAGFAEHLPFAMHRVDTAAPVELRPAATTLESHGTLPAPQLPADRPTHAERPRLGEAGLALYFGDPHNHSRFSYDLDGEADEIYHVARDQAALDFIAFTENDGTRFTEPLTPSDFERSRRLAEHFNDPGRFTAFVAWEYTLHRHPRLPDSYDSHRNVIFPGSDAPVFSWTDGAAATPPELARRLAGTRVLLHHHHPQGLDLTAPALERNIEITSGWWNCMRIPNFVGRLHGFLDDGWRLGFIGGSDNHERNSGLGGALTGVWATENTREAIFQAFEDRRIFATTGLRPDLRFWIGDTFMGSEGRCTAPPELRVFARCETPIEAATIIRDGAVVHAWSGRETTLDLCWRDGLCPPGRHWYYVHLRFADTRPEVDWSKPMPLPWNLKPQTGIDAWTSPIWIDHEPA